VVAVCTKIMHPLHKEISVCQFLAEKKKIPMIKSSLPGLGLCYFFFSKHRNFLKGTHFQAFEGIQKKMAGLKHTHKIT
jgi:hypothetical protein